jgi:glutathione synthase/RimK-type ligase-like ATP-grasp enzyme
VRSTIIFTEPGDHHAMAVEWAIAKKGHLAQRAFLSDLPQLGHLSIDPIGPIRATACLSGQEINLAAFDSVWLRRPGKAVLPRDLHPADRPVARFDWDQTIASLLTLIDLGGIFAVNPGQSYAHATLKPLHLAVAARCGLKVPDTLVSNSINEAGEFLARNATAGAQTIVKGFETVAWATSDGGGASFSTTVITEAMLQDADLGAAPCIFQRLVPKAFEVRLTAMGGTLVAARLDSQESEKTKLDFRWAPDWSTLGCAEITIPAEVKEAVLRFNKEMNFLFGSMDFIVTEKGDWVFLETNTMGNFLWIEDVNPEIPMLDMFSTFICSLDANFAYERPSKPLALFEFDKEYDGSVGEALTREVEIHPSRGDGIIKEAV